MYMRIAIIEIVKRITHPTLQYTIAVFHALTKMAGRLRNSWRLNVGWLSIKFENLVDPASSYMLVSKIKPCMCVYKLLHGEPANGSITQLLAM